MKKYIYLNYGFSSDNESKIKYIKKYGFDGIFLFLDDELENNALLAKNNNLEIQTVHLPFRGCNIIWEDDKLGDDFTDSIIKDIQRVKNINVDTVIYHTSSGNIPPAISEIGLKRIKRILDYCEQNKIFFAIENIRRLEYIDVVFEKLSSDYLKFCFDSGHAMAYSKNILDFPWNKYNKYFHCVHFHDNDGEGDLHEIPFSDKIDWLRLIKDMKENGLYFDATLEIINKNTDGIIEEEFVKNCYEVTKKIEEIYNNV